MKKLKNKIFLVLFSMLTIFVLMILIIYNVILYINEFNGLKESVDTIESITSRPFYQTDFYDKELMFMDLDVYVIRFDSDMNITSVYNYSDDDLTSDDIVNITKQYNKSYSRLEQINLFSAKYVLLMNPRNELIIINIEDINAKLVLSAQVSILIFVLIELLTVYIVKMLTNWLIRPVEEAFLKQKQFIFDASHELKTPLSVIMTSAECLSKNPKETKWLDNIQSETERMNKLVLDLLNLAKYDNSYENRVLSVIDLSKLVEKSVLTFESLIYDKGLNLKYHIDQDVNFKCVDSEMKQLVEILVDNAIKHAYDKSTITVDLIKKKDEISLVVKNRGDKIPKEEQSKIFERFYRSDNSRNRNENRFGLGLAIAKNIVLSHNGKIYVECKNGYTSFISTFKVKNYFFYFF